VREEQRQAYVMVDAFVAAVVDHPGTLCSDVYADQTRSDQSGRRPAGQLTIPWLTHQFGILASISLNTAILTATR
jgi:hypothetical protein